MGKSKLGKSNAEKSKTGKRQYKHKSKNYLNHENKSLILLINGQQVKDQLFSASF